MNKRDEGIERLMGGGLSFAHAAIAFDLMEAFFAAAGGVRQAINHRYYESNKDRLKAKAKEKREIKSLKNPRSDPIKTIQTSEKYLAKVGSAQYDAWNAHNRDRFGKSLPFSDKVNGWLVDSEWPPGHRPPVDFEAALKAHINAAVQAKRIERVASAGEYFDLEADGCADEIALRAQSEARALEQGA